MSYRLFSQLCRVVGMSPLRPVPRTVVRQFHLECKAVRKLVARSVCSQTNFSHRQFCSRPNDKGKEPSSSDPKNKEDPERDEDENRRKILVILMNVLAMYILVNFISMVMPSSQQENLSFVSWNEFYHNMLAKGEVEEVIVRPDINVVTVVLSEGAIIKGKRTAQRTYHMNIVNLEHFEARLRTAEQQLGVMPGSVPIVYERPGTSSYLIGLALLAWAAALVVMMLKGKGGKSSMDMFSQMGKARFTVVDHAVESSKPKVRFTDVAGCHGAKQEVAEFIDYLQDSTKYKKLGAKVPKGVLLLGPPGCGKTMLAKAVAAEAQVPFLAMAGSEFIEMIGGLGAARVRNLFKEARKRSPCIIYIDEIDAIGRKRSSGVSGSGGGEEEQTLNQLLVEMDGMASKEGVLMLASTNRAEVLDHALLRPGRFDRHIMIDLPNLEERVEIFEKHLSNIVLDKSPSRYSTRLAQLTPGFSGADIANVCNEAALHAARTQKKVVSSENIEYAVERVVGGTEKKTHAMSPDERRRVAVHESGHAIVSWLLEHTDNLLKISILPRTKGALGMARYVPTEQKLLTTEQLYEKICLALGGRAAEVVVYGQPSTGAEDDLKRVTKIAKAIVEEYGMDSTIGPLSYPERRPYSKRLVNTMDQRASQLVQNAYATTLELIKKNRDKLTALSDELVRKEVMDYKDVEAILGPRPFGKKPSSV